MSRTQRGFTLVEVLVALSVSALLIGLVYGVVVLGQRSTQAVEKRAADAEVMRIGWHYLHDAITRIRPVSNPLDRDDTTGFDGTAERLVFVADQPAYIGPGGLTRIVIEVRDEDGVDSLVLTRDVFDPGFADDESKTTQQAVLIDDLELLQIRYFGAGEDSESAAWVDSWQDAPSLPSLVEIRVTPRGGSAWPLLIAHPIAGAGPVDSELPLGDDPGAPEADETETDEPPVDEDLPTDARA